MDLSRLCCRYVHLDSIDSTNTFCKSLGHRPIGNDLIVVHADRQSGGRGQRGNSFFSDSCGGLWASVVCCGDNIDAHFAHNRAMILAVMDSILLRVPDAPVAIKWPNDLYWEKRKVCGMLLETAGPGQRFLIIGFGINVNISASEFPPELSSIATSLFIETGNRFPIDRLLEDIIAGYRNWIRGDQRQAHRMYHSRLLGLGRQVMVDRIHGLFADVEEDGRLRLETEHGIELLSSGPLRIIE